MTPARPARSNRPWQLVPLGLIAACAWLSGCAPLDPPKPVVAFVSPADGAQYLPGERIPVRVAAAATRGVARVEVRQGDQLVGAQDNPTQPATFSTSIDFVAQRTGDAVLQATAIDAAGVASDPASLTLRIVERISLLPTITPYPDEAQTAPEICQDNAEFVADVTIPDNTPIQAGEPFVKTWRLRNTGACGWGAGYEIVYIQGSRMNAPPAVPVVSTPPGGEADVSVSFIAPREPGIYTSTWQLRGPQGLLFGNRVFAVIQVP